MSAALDQITSALYRGHGPSSERRCFFFLCPRFTAFGGSCCIVFTSGEFALFNEGCLRTREHEVIEEALSRERRPHQYSAAAR